MMKRSSIKRRSAAMVVTVALSSLVGVGCTSAAERSKERYARARANLASSQKTLAAEGAKLRSMLGPKAVNEDSMQAMAEKLDAQQRADAQMAVIQKAARDFESATEGELRAREIVDPERKLLAFLGKDAADIRFGCAGFENVASCVEALQGLEDHWRKFE